LYSLTAASAFCATVGVLGSRHTVSSNRKDGSQSPDWNRRTNRMVRS